MGSMKAVILVGGLGTRLRAFVNDRPKPMAEIAKRPFLEHLIEQLKLFGIREFVFCHYYKPEFIIDHFKDGKKYGVKIDHVIQKENLNTGGAVKLAQDLLDDTFLVLNGDTLFPINFHRLIDFHRTEKGLGTIALSQVSDVSAYGLVEVAQNGQITAFKEKQASGKVSGTVNGGIYVLEPEVLDLIPAGKPVSLERKIFPKLLKTQKGLYGYQTDLAHFDIGTPIGFRRAEAYLKEAQSVVVRSRAPVRIAFGGGGTDLEPYISQIGGVVLNATINKYVYGTLELRNDRRVKIVAADYKKSSLYDDIKDLRRDSNIDLIKAVVKRMGVDYGFELFVRSDIPPNTGLGSSGAVAVAVIGLFNHFRKADKLSRYEVAELAYQVEMEDLKNVTGRQDQYAAVFGGVNLFEFLGGDFVKVSAVNLSVGVKNELEKNLLLVYLGRRKESGDLQKEWLRKSGAKGKSAAELDEIKRLAYESHQALMRFDLDNFGYLLGEAWELKKTINPEVSTPFVAKVYEEALRLGALGGRVAGSGGGGHMILYCRSNTEQEVARAVRKLGAEVVDFSFEDGGLQTWEVE